MGVRNKIKVGDHLMMDSRTGEVHYASEMTQDWDGTWVKKGTEDGEHPFDHYNAIFKEDVPVHINPVDPLEPTVIGLRPTVGASGVARAKTPSDFLFPELENDD